MAGLVFKFQHMIYEERQYYLNRKKYNYETNGILWQIQKEIMQHS